MTTARPCIAVVDDEESVRRMLRRVLRLANYEVTEFASGDDFLASLATQVPACVVLDVHMPGPSGLDVQARLQASHKCVPVVFITASDDRTLDKIVQDAGGAPLLRKPFCSNELLDAVSAAIRSTPCDAS